MVRVYGISFEHPVLMLLVLSFVFILANILNRMFDGKAVSVFYFVAASWLGVVFVAFSGVIAYEVVGFIVPGESVILMNVVIFVIALSSIYALLNGGRIVTKEYTLPMRGLETERKIIHLSDVHVGTVHQKKFLDRVVEMTNSLKPDLILMTGDLFDGSEPIHEEMLRPLDKLNAPTYFSTGNHEEYEGLQRVRETISGLKMELLDSRVAVENEIQIIGVNDRQSLPRDASLDSILGKIDLNDEKPTILMYHTPVEWHAARKHGVDLMLSGHTHNGQIYPFNLLVKLQFKYINGLYQKEGKHLHVSPVTGTWGPPMRLGSRNQITLLELVPII